MDIWIYVYWSRLQVFDSRGEWFIFDSICPLDQFGRLLFSSFRAFASIVGWTRTTSRDPGSLCPELVCHPWKKTQLRVLIQHWAPCGAHSCELCMRQKSTWNSADARNAFGVPFKFSRFVDTHGGEIIEEVVPMLPCFRKNPRRPWEWHRSFSDAWWYRVGPSTLRVCFN